MRLTFLTKAIYTHLHLYVLYKKTNKNNGLMPKLVAEASIFIKSLHEEKKLSSNN